MIKRVVLRCIFFAIALGIMLFIFNMSAETAEESSNTSGGLTLAVIKLFYPDFDEFAVERQQQISNIFSIIVRKSAHFSIYTALGMSLCAGMHTYKNLNKRLKILLPIIISAAYAVTDEVHQLFVSGRSCEINDMLIDTSGATLGAFAVLLIVIIAKKIIKNKESKNSQA